MLLTQILLKKKAFNMIKEMNNLAKKNKVLDIGKYFLSKCGKLPKGRLVKLFYLLDWRSALEQGETITQFKWYYNHFGPYLPELINALTNNENDILISAEKNSFGNPSDYVTINPDIKLNDNFNLEKKEIELVEIVINATKDLNFDQFIKFVYSTYPVRTSQKYSELDLVKLADHYKKLQS